MTILGPESTSTEAQADPAALAATPPESRNRRVWLHRAIPIAALMVGLAAGITTGIAVTDPTSSEEYQALEQRLDDAQGRATRLSDEAREARGAARTAQEQTAQRAAELDGRERALAAREEAVKAVEAQVEANSIAQGIWTVGRDVSPGTYRTSEAILGECYWSITVTGTNGSDIVENDIPSGGFPTVTLREGQDFENNGCGTFVKQ